MYDNLVQLLLSPGAKSGKTVEVRPPVLAVPSLAEIGLSETFLEKKWNVSRKINLLAAGLMG